MYLRPCNPDLITLIVTATELRTKEMTMALNKELLKILCCPKCKGDLELLDKEEGLKCAACAVVYPVREEIPVMLIDEAIPEVKWEQGVREI